MSFPYACPEPVWVNRPLLAQHDGADEAFPHSYLLARSDSVHRWAPFDPQIVAVVVLFTRGLLEDVLHQVPALIREALRWASQSHARSVDSFIGGLSFCFAPRSHDADMPRRIRRPETYPPVPDRSAQRPVRSR
jgi:hypothetical protein